MRPFRIMTVGVLGTLAATTAEAQMSFDPAFDPVPAVDINPDPNIFEIDLVAAPVTWEFIPGVPSQVFAYNGQIPGPFIDMNMGQTLRVNFTNNLGEDTTIHWHGVDAPADMDGSHISQLTIPDGGTFTYEFDMLTPGLKWYHPHVRTDYMVEHGLYGPILVRDQALEAALNIQGEEHIVIFDDIAMDPVTGVLDTFDETDPLKRAIYQLSGRIGNVLLVNGKEAASMPPLKVSNGQPQRWYVLNVANSKFARLDLNEHYQTYPAVIGSTPYQIPSQQWLGDVWKIGGDRGLLQTRVKRPPIVEVIPSGDHFIFDDFRGILLTPGERMDVSFTPFGADGEILPVDSWDWARGDHVAFYKPDGTIGLGDAPDDGFKDTLHYFDMELVGTDPGPPYYAPPTVLNAGMEVLKVADANKTVNVTFGHAPPDAAGDVIFFAQMGGGGPIPMKKMTSLEAFDVDIGDIVLWNVTNLTHGDHPFHTHGFAFQHVDTEYFDSVTPANEGVEIKRAENKDTLLIPARTGAKGTSKTVVRALMKIDDTGRVGRLTAQGRWPTATTSGGFLFHCHILEHAARGMMGFFEVFDPASPFANLGGATANLSGGHSYLSGTGTVTGGNPMTVDLQDAIPGALSVMVVSPSQTVIPLNSGFILPTVNFVIGPFFADANGDVNQNFVWPAGLPSGTELFWQFATFETASDFHLSNALSTKQL